MIINLQSLLFIVLILMNFGLVANAVITKVNDIKHLNKMANDYYSFKERVIERLARIEEKLGIKER